MPTLAQNALAIGSTAGLPEALGRRLILGVILNQCPLPARTIGCPITLNAVKRSNSLCIPFAPA